LSSRPRIATDAPKTNDQRTAVLRSVDKIDELLDCVERRNRDLQTELQALLKEIVALRSEETKAFGTRASDTTPAQKGVEVRSIDRAEKSSDNAKQAGEKLAGQEEGGMDGGTFDQGPAHYRNNQFLLVVSPLGDKVGLYDTQTQKSQPLRLSDGERKKPTVTPNFSGEIVALSVQGEKVSRVAVAIYGRWYPQDLREPAISATPMIGNEAYGTPHNTVKPTDGPPGGFSWTRNRLASAWLLHHLTMSPDLRQSFGRDLVNADLAPEFFSVDTDLARRGDPEFYAVPIDRNHGDRQLTMRHQNPFTKPAAEDEHEVFLLGLALFAC
jgi:hypothetical protein